MTTETWKREKDLCRCCHSEGTLRSIYARYFWMDVEEVVYADMLRECFDIELASVTEPSNQMLCMICYACIQRLQDASQFKRQVLKCERQFRKMYLGYISKDPAFEVNIKEELSDPEENVLEREIIESHNGVIKDDHTSGAADDGTAADGDRWSTDQDDGDIIPVKTVKIAKHKKSKNASSKVKNKKKVGRPKKKPAPAVEEEGAIKVVKRKRILFRLQEDIDYKRVGDMFQCIRCDMTTKIVDKLRRHVKTIHLKIPRYTCAHCSKTFQTLSPFMIHKLEEHNIDDRYRCNACENIFNSNIQLRRHINCFHMLGAKHKCDKCVYETFSLEALYKHRYKHKTVKDYHCKYCRKSFLRKATLQLHERIHTGDRRKVCKVCGQAFVQKASLNYHMTKYHPGVDF